MCYLFDDKNPQMDLQAQDRAHRIGQTRPVLIYRLVSRYTIESKIMQRASEKRQLEALVIAKGKFHLTPLSYPITTHAENPSFSPPPGKFKAPIGGSAKASEARQTITEMAAELLELEGEHVEVASKRGVISDAELEMLLDRRKEVFEGRGVGWKSGASVKNSGSVGGAPAAAAPAAGTVTGRGKADSGLFEVYQAPKDEGNDALAHMLGEDVVA